MADAARLLKINHCAHAAQSSAKITRGYDACLITPTYRNTQHTRWGNMLMINANTLPCSRMFVIWSCEVTHGRHALYGEGMRWQRMQMQSEWHDDALPPHIASEHTRSELDGSQSACE